MTSHVLRTNDRSEVVWHRGIDEAIPSMLVTRNEVCVARIFASGKWVVVMVLGSGVATTFETGFSKNLDVAKTEAEDSMIRCTSFIAQRLLDWVEKHRREPSAAAAAKSAKKSKTTGPEQA